MLPVSIFFFPVVFCYLCTFPLFVLFFSVYSLAVVVLLARGGVIVATASGSKLWFSLFLCFWVASFFSLFLLLLSFMMVELLSMGMLLVFLLPNRVVVQWGAVVPVDGSFFFFFCVFFFFCSIFFLFSCFYLFCVLSSLFSLFCVLSLSFFSLFPPPLPFIPLLYLKEARGESRPYPIQSC